MVNTIFVYSDATGDKLEVDVLYMNGREPEFIFTSTAKQDSRQVQVLLRLDQVVKLLSALRIEVDVALNPNDPEQGN